MSADDGLERIAALLREHPAVALACHEGADGDAIGSLRALGDALADGGWDVALWAPGTAPLPADLALLDVDGIPRDPPVDLERRLLVALDCGSLERLGADGPAAATRAVLVANVDHHGDNTRFGDAVAVDAGAACTTLLVDRLTRRLGLALGPRARLAVYVGLVTDTGRFMYGNTTSEAHETAARLIAEGVRPDEVFRALYEGRSAARLRLHARCLDRLRLLRDGRLAVVDIAIADLDATGAEETDGEGIVDQLRAVRGVEVAAVVREPRAERGRVRKCSLRSATPAIDVARVAQALGGGGHPMAAGFASELPVEAIVAAIERELDRG